jgi:uncharacterized membrane protein
VLTANLWQQNQPPVIYFIVIFPLAMFAPGIWVDNMRTQIWMGFVLLLYFASAVFGVTKPNPSLLDIAELTLTVVLFCGSMLYTRTRQVNPDIIPQK